MITLDLSKYHPGSAVFEANALYPVVSSMENE